MKMRPLYYLTPEGERAYTHDKAFLHLWGTQHTPYPDSAWAVLPSATGSIWKRDSQYNVESRTMLANDKDIPRQQKRHRLRGAFHVIAYSDTIIQRQPEQTYRQLR